MRLPLAILAPMFLFVPAETGLYTIFTSIPFSFAILEFFSIRCVDLSPTSISSNLSFGYSSSATLSTKPLINFTSPVVGITIDTNGSFSNIFLPFAQSVFICSYKILLNSSFNSSTSSSFLVKTTTFPDLYILILHFFSTDRTVPV